MDGGKERMNSGEREEKERKEETGRNGKICGNEGKV
jgi:hypothetical protein